MLCYEMESDDFYVEVTHAYSDREVVIWRIVVGVFMYINTSMILIRVDPLHCLSMIYRADRQNIRLRKFYGSNIYFDTKPYFHL